MFSLIRARQPRPGGLEVGQHVLRQPDGRGHLRGGDSRPKLCQIRRQVTCQIAAEFIRFN